MDFREYIHAALNDLSLTILKNIERNMKYKLLFKKFTLYYLSCFISRRINPQTSTYNFESNTFMCSIWARRSVPQIHNKWLGSDNVIATFDIPTAIIKCQSSMNMNKMAIRIIWTSYDHYSDLSPTYKLKRHQNTVINDLKTVNELEWNIRESIKELEINRMRDNWVSWKKLEIERLEQEEIKLKEKSKNKKLKKQTKKVKIIPEPICPDDNTAVDVEDIFIEHYNELLQKEVINNSPDVDELKFDELNMRCYRIMGGVFHINAIIQPEQTKEVEYKVFQNLDNKQELTFANELNCSTSDSDMIEIKLKLSNKIFWWTTPIVCKWIEMTDDNFRVEKGCEITGGSLFLAPEIKPNFAKVDTIEDFDLLNPPDEMNKNIITFLERHIIPRLPDTFKFDMELDEEREIIRKKLLREKEIEMEQIEQRARKKAEFDTFLAEFRTNEVNLLTNRLETLKTELLVARTEATRKLTNSGESEKNVEKYLKKKETEDEEYLNDIEKDGNQKIDEMILKMKNEHLLLKVEPIDELNTTSVQHDVEANNSPPRELYPKREKKYPLRIISQESGEIFEFDIPDIKDNLGLDLNRPEQAPIYASKFLKFLHSLHKIEETKPFEKNAKNRKPKKLKEIKQTNSRKNSINEKQKENFSGRWITTNINVLNYKTTTNEIIFESKYFGIFGFALPRYCLYPIKYWEIKPEAESKEQIVTIIIETSRITLKIIVSRQGYSATIVQPPEMRERLDSPNPMDYKTFEDWLTNQGIDFFPKLDAQYYIPSANVKHTAMEMHAYNCLTQFALTYKFWQTPHNQLADNRTALVYSMELIENSEQSVVREIMIKPEMCMFVHRTEQNTSPMRVELNHEEVPEEQEFCPDLYFLLIASCNEMSKRKRNQMRMVLKYNVAFILEKLKLFCYS